MLDLASLESCLPLGPEEEATLTVRTVGSLRLSDLPQQALLSPTKESSGRPSTAVCFPL